MLQQPTHPNRLDPRYHQLLSALDTGWRIEEPVYLHPRWGDGGRRVYHFILRREGVNAPRLLTVPANADVERFVRDEGLTISVRR